MKLYWIATAWLAYAVLHSVLASLSIKEWVARRWPSLMPAYRLAFNAVATLTLAPVLWLVYSTESEWLWRWHGPLAWVANGLALAAIGGVVWSARAYDMDEFIGLRQWRQHDHGADDREGFTLSPLHRFVRHPWYFFSLVLVWTRDMNGPLLVSALAVTGYFVIGSWLEERKLAVLHGAAYRRYCERVPGLIPRPWRFLTAEDAAALVQGTRHR